jgi:hypothetical protein
MPATTTGDTTSFPFKLNAYSALLATTDEPSLIGWDHPRTLTIKPYSASLPYNKKIA